MENRPANGHRIHFSKIVAQTPVLLAQEGSRYAILIVHDSSVSLRVGNSGTVQTNGLLLPSSAYGFWDDLSTDAYWAYYPAGSGTVTGFVVV